MEIRLVHTPAHAMVYAMQLDVRSFDMTKTEENGVQSYSAKVEARHNVDESGLQHMMIQVCPNEVNIKTFSVEGELTFHNPYGFLPVSTPCCGQ